MKKYLSRKFLALLGTGILNVLAMLNVIPQGTSEQYLKCLDAVAGCYIVVEGAIDGLKKQ